MEGPGSKAQTLQMVPGSQVTMDREWHMRQKNLAARTLRGGGSMHRYSRNEITRGAGTNACEVKKAQKRVITFAFILVLFILLVIIIGTRTFTTV